ncbi:MAG TPA: cytochrome C [Cerasibacillus sp.]|uniref:c-type cytochrome n=1 Tax=Cerasibacillus sp. TaxID=2498711 RepID=UPI002F3F1119
MKQNGIIFIITFIIAFAGGYFIFSGGDQADQAQSASSSDTEATEQSKAEATDAEKQTDEEADVAEETVPADAEPLSANNCLNCHSVGSLGANGGTTGPDLSNAFTDVKGKHGKELDEFLKEPTSQVMTGVIEGDPLSDEEREQIVEALKKAAEQK